MKKDECLLGLDTSALTIKSIHLSLSKGLYLNFILEKVVAKLASWGNIEATFYLLKKLTNLRH